MAESYNPFEHMHIREPTEQDLSDLMSIEKECFVDYYRAHRFRRSQFNAYLLDKLSIFLVGIHGSALTGYIVGRVRLGRSRHSARIESIAVSRSDRKRGIGGTLIKRFIKGARGHGCKSITLEVAVVNEEAIRLFTRHKFTPCRRLSAYYSPGLDAIQMKYSIPGDKGRERRGSRILREVQ